MDIVLSNKFNMNLVRSKAIKISFLLTSMLICNVAWAQSPGMFTTYYQIEVQLSDYKNDTLILAHHLGKKQYTVDTALVDNTGKAIFKGSDTDTLRYGIYLVYIPNVKYFDILVNEPSISIATSVADPVRDMNATTSKDNQIFYDYLRYLNKAREQSVTLKQKIEEATADQKSGLQSKLSALDASVKKYIDELIEKNKETFAAKTIKANKQIEIPEGDQNSQYQYYYKHFWDNIDLNEERFIYSPWLEAKLNQYITKLTMQHPDSINKTADWLIAASSKNKHTKRYVVQYLTNLYAESNLMSSEAVYVHLINNYYTPQEAWWVDKTTLYRMQMRAKAVEPLLIGKKIPNLLLNDQNGQSQNLANKDNKYTVLFFYDPTCGTCKKHAPIMEEVRQQYAANGVKFWGIALDVDNSDDGIQKWKDFIEEKGLQAWTNVADLTGEQALLAKYDVRKTPTIYVLDEHHEIILKRLGAEQLGEILGEVIANENEP